MRYGYLLLILALFRCSDALSVTWSKTFGGDGDDYGYSIRQTTDGGYIIAGCTHYGFFEGDSGDVYLIKTDSLGDTLWTKAFGGDFNDVGYSVCQTTDGGYIIAGCTNCFYEGNSGDVYLIKTDSLGDTLWTKTFGGNFNDIGYSVCQTTDEGYIITGYTNYSFERSSGDVYLIKTDSLGDTLWTKTFGGDGADCGYSVCQALDGGYTVTGGGRSNLIKTDSLGDTLWTKTYGGRGNSVFLTQDGGYVITGLVGGAYSDVWLIKTDSLGDTLWTRTFGSNFIDIGYSVFQTSDGGYIITGRYEGMASVPAICKLYIIKTDSAGDTMWTRTFQKYCTSVGRSVCETSDKGYIVAGYTGECGGDGKDCDIWVIKLDSLGNIGVEEVESLELRIESQLQIKPNPFVQSTIIRFEDSRLQIEDCRIKIHDLGGRLVEETDSDIIGKSLRTGVYFVKVKGYKPIKIVKLR